MEAPDVTREHGARVAPNIREWWPYLTDQDIQTLNTWRWHTGHVQPDVGGVEDLEDAKIGYDGGGRGRAVRRQCCGVAGRGARGYTAGMASTREEEDS